MLITNGSLQADAFLFDHLVSPGDDVVVEKPTYDRTLLNLRTMGAKVHQVSLDTDGLDIDELRRLLESGVRPKLAHVIPNFQNPAGMTLSLERRRALIELAREYRFTIFEDDPYVDIRFRGEPLPSMLSLDDPANPTVVAAGSFTKTVCPGVRVGYLIGPTAVIADIAKRAVNTYISPNMLSEVTVHQFCVTGDIDRSIATVRAALSERATLLAQALRREIPGLPVRRARRRLLPLGRAAGRHRRGRRWPRPPRPAGSRWSRAATSCWRAASTRCGWPTRRSSPTRSTRASRRLAAAIADVRG